MPRRKKHAVRKGKGSMCNICGINCGRGGPLKMHIEKGHKIKYEDYKMCFEGKMNTLIVDSWNDSISTKSGKKSIVHVLVRRFVGDPGPRGVRK